MNREDSNLNMLLLVLVRPSDSLHSLLSTFFPYQRYEFIVCTSIFEVFGHLAKRPDTQMTVLILRPAILTSEVGEKLLQHFERLKIIGLLDRNDQLSDLAFQDNFVTPMVMVHGVLQLQRAIEVLVANDSHILPNHPEAEMSGAGFKDRLKYDLSDDEINALIGVQ